MMNPIEQMRLKQSQTQFNSVKGRRGEAAQMATYVDRDPASGDRLMKMPDGGTIRQNWIANSRPVEIPALTIPSKQIGLSGFTTQKPS